MLWRYELSKLRERALMALAWRLPRSLVYWCAIRLIAGATCTRSPDEISAMDALKAWGDA